MQKRDCLFEQLRNREYGRIRLRDARLQEEFWRTALEVGTGAGRIGAVVSATYYRLMPNVECE